MNYLKIENKSELLSYLKRFDDKELHIIALDIEVESNLHVYGEKLCLAQIFDGVNNVIIDPFDIDNDTLKLLFENPNTLKVMYDAGSDLSMLKNSANIEIKSILDLRPATELLNYDKRDLHSIIASELGIFLEKKRKYQQHNWTKRPIDEGALDYAINDVIHLLVLKDIILAKLYTKKLLEPFLLKNVQIQNKDYTRDPEDKYRKIRGYGRLSDNRKIVFRKVFDIREKYAKSYNMTPHTIIQKTDLINIVEEPAFVSKIRFTKRISVDSIKDILKELRAATKGIK